MNGKRLRPGVVLGVVAALLGGMFAISGAATAEADVTWTVSSMSPASGSTAGGTTVTITGTGFQDVVGVTLQKGDGSAYLEPLQIVSQTSTQIIGVTLRDERDNSDAPAGQVNVFLFGQDGYTSLVSGGFTFVTTTPPTTTSISPTSGPTAGGTSVVITGTNFTGATGVSFGGTAASFTVNSATQITAAAPAHAAGGAGVTVTTPYGTSAGTTYTYIAPPTVTGISPTSGPTAGGTTVTITGTDFTGATQVRFGAANATSVTVNSSTSITGTAPAGTGTVDVRVTTPGGTSATSASDQFTYVAPPTLTSVTPTSGTAVTITGANLSAASSVTFDGVNASYLVISSTEITATTPVHVADGATVVVTTPYGTSNGMTFNYVAPPTVTGLSPAAGPLAGGGTVTVHGTDFTVGSTVKFGGIAATSAYISASELLATVPAHAAGTVDVQVTTQYGSSAASAADQYTYAPAPTVGGISPTSGPASGGTAVTITGTGFTPDSTVAFGGTTASSVTVISTTQLSAIAPVGTGTVDVTVTTPGGISATSAADRFGYIPRPVVTGVSPASGLATDSATVTITGTDFTGATGVSFAQGGSATSFTLDSATQITATLPESFSGDTIDLLVTTPGGISATNAADTFTYRPVITSLSPVAITPGALAGAMLTVNGIGFGLSLSLEGHLSTVTVDGQTTTFDEGLVSDSHPGYAIVTLPGSLSLAAGLYPVVLTRYDGQSATATLVVTTVPAITGVSPAAGPLGGASVVLTGSGFTGASAITLDGTDLSTSAYTVVSDTEIDATLPATTAAGEATIRVTNPLGTSAPAAFAYVAVPAVTGVLPAAVQAGTTSGVIVTGTGFAGATAVTVGGTAAVFTITNDTQILLAAPALTAGTIADIRVTTVGGTSAATTADQVTYYAAADIAGIAPATGPTAGGTDLVISGSGFTGTTAVTVGGTAATSFTVVSDTEIDAVVPAGAAGTADVVVTNLVGASAPAGFTYVAPPAIAALSPASGPFTGGTTVVLTGTDFAGTTAVTFGLVPATSFTVVSDTEIDAVAPAGAGTGPVNVVVTTPYGSSAIGGASYLYLPVLAVTTDLPTPITGQPYRGTVVVGGDAGPFTFDVTAGALPAGLTLGADGTISGTPTAVGDDSFTITVTDTGTPVPVIASTNVTLTVYNGALTVIGTPVAGQPVTVTGSDLVPGPGTLVLHSDPVTLGAVTVAPDGTFTATVTIPADTVPGAHEIELVNAEDALTAVVAITVQAAPVLASTGTDPWPGIALGLLLLGAGAFATGMSRRRKA